MLILLSVLKNCASQLSERDRCIKSKYRHQVNHIKSTLLPSCLSHLPDEVILQAYLSRERDPSQAVSLLQAYVKGRKEYPKYFPTSYPSPHFRPELMDEGVIGYASGVRSIQGNHILFTDWAKWDVNRVDAASYFYTVLSLNGAITRSHANNEEGVITILDVGGIGFSHVKAATSNTSDMLTPMNVTTYYATMNIVKQIVLNSGTLFGMIWSIASKLAPKRVQDITVFVSGDKQLSKYLPPDAVKDKSYIPTKQDRILSRQMAEEWEEFSIKLYNRIMK